MARSSFDYPPRLPAGNGVSCTASGPGTPGQATSSLFVATANPDLLPLLKSKLAYSPDLEIGGDCSGSRELLFRVLERCSPSVLLVDMQLVERLGPQALRDIRAQAPVSHLMLLYEHSIELPVDEIIHNNVLGCYWLGLPDSFLERAIRAIMDGELWLPRPLERRIFETMRKHLTTAGAPETEAPNPRAASLLTHRESEAAQLVRQGLSNKEIARKLDISEDTVKAHLKHVFEKLGLHRRSQIALSGVKPTSNHT